MEREGGRRGGGGRERMRELTFQDATGRAKIAGAARAFRDGRAARSAHGVCGAWQGTCASWAVVMVLTRDTVWQGVRGRSCQLLVCVCAVVCMSMRGCAHHCVARVCVCVSVCVWCHVCDRERGCVRESVCDREKGCV